MAADYELYRITPPAGADDEAFERFIADDVVPAVYTGLTRVGAVDSILLLREEDASTKRHLLLVGTNGLNQAPEVLTREAREMLDARGARVSVVRVTTVSSWERP
jgi:hypothetical protein